MAGMMLQIRAATRSTLVSHSRAVVSPLAVARVCPSGLNATKKTALVWPVRVASAVGWRGSLRSHNRAVPESARREGVEGEQVGGQQPGGLGVREAPPPGVGSAWCRPEVGGGQGSVDGAGAEVVSELDEVTVDAAVIPGTDSPVPGAPRGHGSRP